MKARPSSCQANPSESLPISAMTGQGPCSCCAIDGPIATPSPYSMNNFLMPHSGLVGAAYDRDTVELPQALQLFHEPGHRAFNGPLFLPALFPLDRFRESDAEPGRGFCVHANPGAGAEQGQIEDGEV